MTSLNSIFGHKMRKKLPKALVYPNISESARIRNFDPDQGFGFGLYPSTVII
jgi:hypothetical protein